MKLRFKYLIIPAFALLTQQVLAQSTAEPAEKPMDHSHMPIALPEEALPISLSLELTKDVMSGYNLTLLTKHYQFMMPPSDMSMMEMMGVDIAPKSNYVRGHGHLYVNGEKIQRIYGPNLHLPAELFRDGVNSISVTLNNHGHMFWTMADKKVLATVFIDKSKEKLITHRFESFPVTVN